MVKCLYGEWHLCCGLFLNKLAPAGTFHRTAAWDSTCQSLDHYAELFALTTLQVFIYRQAFPKIHLKIKFRFHDNFPRNTIVNKVPRKPLKQSLFQFINYSVVPRCSKEVLVYFQDCSSQICLFAFSCT